MGRGKGRGELLEEEARGSADQAAPLGLLT